MSNTENYFSALNAVNVNDKVEKKGGLSYLSWAWAWGEVKMRHPDATYTVYENDKGWNFHTDGMTCWVKTGVTINGIEHIEYLPVMDQRNRSIPLGTVTSFDVNKAIQRSITKACARHGLGLYIYAGEDLPDGEETDSAAKKPAVYTPAHANEWHVGAIEKAELQAKLLPDDMKKCYAAYGNDLHGMSKIAYEKALERAREKAQA